MEPTRLAPQSSIAAPASAFVCRRCGACCRGEGRVWLEPEDVDALAREQDLTVEAFTQRYTRLDPSRRGLILADGPDGDCIFLQADGKCAVHDVKPQQCRTFPMRWRNPTSSQTCPGCL